MGEFEFKDNSQKFVTAKHYAVQKALEMIGMQAESYAKLDCPVDTGRLRNSISHARETDAVYIGTNVEYAPYVEYGTSRTKAKPYLKPAATGHNEEYKRIVEECLKNA